MLNRHPLPFKIRSHSRIVNIWVALAAVKLVSRRSHPWLLMLMQGGLIMDVCLILLVISHQGRIEIWQSNIVIQGTQDFGKALAISCNSFICFPFWHLFPCVVVCRHALEVDQVFLTSSAGYRAQIPLGKHPIVIRGVFVNNFKYFPNLFGYGAESLIHIVFQGKKDHLL